ncbi:MAG: metal-sulfur cluster assembly factor [Actinomycetota bacterium]
MDEGTQLETAGSTVDGTDQPSSGGNVGAANGSLEERVLDALRNVDDPELGINIVDLGLVYDVTIEGDTVHITYTLTTMGCPIGPMIEAQMKQFLSEVEGVNNVDAEMVLSPPWTPEKMSEEAKAALGFI